MSQEQIFWDWFKMNEAQYFFLNQINEENEKERLLDLFLNQLHNYCDHLYFEIGGNPNDTQDLIITAEGDVNYFSKVEYLVEAAPKLEYWNLIAFKPIRENFIANFEGAMLDPNEMWFIPLNNKNPKQVALRLYSDNYDEDNNLDFLTAAYLVLDNILGEKSNALDIGYIEIENSLSIVDKNDLIILNKLPKYINWYKSKNT